MTTSSDALHSPPLIHSFAPSIHSVPALSPARLRPTCSDDEVRALHPAHSQASMRALLPRLRPFGEGTCIVHHLFGGEVCELVR